MIARFKQVSTLQKIRYWAGIKNLLIILMFMNH